MSEVEFQSELNVPLSLRAAYLAESQAGDIHVRAVEVRCICQVEEFGPELDPFRLDGYTFLQRQIEILQARSPYGANSRVAERSGHRLLKVGRANPTCARANLM